MKIKDFRYEFCRGYIAKLETDHFVEVSKMVGPEKRAIRIQNNKLLAEQE